MPQTIYCDESGFTGEQLSNREQRHFGYASVALEAKRAEELVAQMVKDFRFQGSELKASRLLRHNPGRKAIAWLAQQVFPHSQIAVHNKMYALAGKVFEYTYEPLISNVSSVFYAVDFQRFIANMIYLQLRVRNERSERLLLDFEESVREEDEEVLREFLAVRSSKPEDPLEQIISFCVFNKDEILRKLAEVKELGGWVLELTGSSVVSLLRSWGERYDSLIVCCDKSKPLATFEDFINGMVGCTEKRYVQFGDRKFPITFNLHEPIHLVESKEHAGIQIADILAGAVCYAMKDPKGDSWSRRLLWSAVEHNVIHEDSVLPNEDHVDPDDPKVLINAAILLELNERSARGESLTEGMADFIRAAYRHPPDPAMM